jgi:hypothetical protein
VVPLHVTMGHARMGLRNQTSVRTCSTARTGSRRSLRSVSVEGVTEEFSRMTHHFYCIGLRDNLPSLNAQGHSAVS